MNLPENLADLPVVYPFKRLLYSRKVMLAVGAVLIAILGELGLPEEIVNTVNELALWIIGSWTAKDVATNLANGKK